MKYVEAIIAQGMNFMSKGMVPQAQDKYEDANKLLMAMPDGGSHPLFGEILLQQALTTLSFGRTHSSPLYERDRLMNNLDTGKFGEARLLAERSQAVLAKSYGGGNVQATNAIFVKAEALRLAGKYKEATVLVEQTLVSRRRRYGDSHPLIADCLVTNGVCLMFIAKYQEAERYLRTALTMREQYFGASGDKDQMDSRIAEVLYWQAVLEAILGRFEASLALHELALKIQLRFLKLSEDELNARFQRTTTRKNPMSSSSSKRTNSAKKEAKLNQLVDVDKPVMPISDIYLALGKIYLELGRYDMAETYIHRALNIRIGVNHSEDSCHFKIVECNLAVARLNRFRGNYQVENSLVGLLSTDGLRLALGKEHPLYQSCQQELAEWYRDSGELSESMKIGQLVMEWRLENLGDEHPDCAESLLALAETCRETGKCRRARELLASARAILNVAFGDLAGGGGGGVHILAVKTNICAANIALSEFENPEPEVVEPPNEEDEVDLIEEAAAAAVPGLMSRKSTESSLGKKSLGEERSQGEEEEEGGGGEGDSQHIGSDVSEERPPPDAEEVHEEEEKKKLPVFDNELYRSLTDAFRSPVEQLKAVFSSVSHLLINRSVDAAEAASAVSMSSHPLLHFLRATLGVISVHEFRKRQEFLDALPPDVQQEVKAEELMRKRKARELTIAPDGVQELQAAIQVMYRVDRLK